jgi:hypothetical protein
MLVPDSLDYCSFVMSYKIRKYEPSDFMKILKENLEVNFYGCRLGNTFLDMMSRA